MCYSLSQVWLWPQQISAPKPRCIFSTNRPVLPRLMPRNVPKHSCSVPMLRVILESLCPEPHGLTVGENRLPLVRPVTCFREYDVFLVHDVMRIHEILIFIIPPFPFWKTFCSPFVFIPMHGIAVFWKKNKVGPPWTTVWLHRLARSRIQCRLSCRFRRSRNIRFCFHPGPERLDHGPERLDHLFYLLIPLILIFNDKITLK